VPSFQPNPLLAALFGGIVSLGVYRLLLTIIESLLSRIEFIKKLILYKSYLEGTWVGCYVGSDDTPVYFIEVFEQTFDTLFIRGRCFFDNNAKKGQWISERVIIDENRASLSYTYETDMIASTHKNQGFAVFFMIFDGKSKIATRLEGFSSDIFMPKKVLSMEIKIMKPHMFTDVELIEKARELFSNNREFFGYRISSH